MKPGRNEVGFLARSALHPDPGLSPASRHAFSMIELLVVVAILMLLLTFMWSPRSGKREVAVQGACQRQMEKVFMALQIYANEHGGAFPASAEAQTSAEALDPLVPKYTSDTASFVCPGKPQPLRDGEPFSRQKISYSYYMGCFATNPQQVLLTDAQVDTNSKTHGKRVFSIDGKAPGDNHGKRGGNLLFCDGRVQPIPSKTPFELLASGPIKLLNP